MQGLASFSGAGIDHAHALLRVKDMADQLRRRVLNLEQSFAETRECKDVAFFRET